MRAKVALVFALLASATACATILGLEERTLVPSEGGAGDATADTGVPDSGPSPCVAEHAFCEDFDDVDTSFDAAIALWKRWGYLQGYIGDNAATGSTMTIETDPTLDTPPHDLRVDVKLPTILTGNLGVGAMLHQVMTTDPSVVGIDVRALVRVDRLQPDWEAGALLDSGERLVGGTLGIVNPDANDGVAVVWTSGSGVLGYATGFNTLTSRFAQGDVFWQYGPPPGQWLPLRLVVAPVKHPALAGLECKNGIAVYQADGGVVVADGGNASVYGVGVFFQGAKGCELLGADLASPDWTRHAVVVIGVIAQGAGAMSASFDDVVVDFVR